MDAFWRVMDEEFALEWPELSRRDGCRPVSDGHVD
jgi:hypothetical protein